MAYDIRRAALVTCCLATLLLAASLMPAAGLGSFPSLGGGEGDAPAVPGGPERPQSPATTERPQSPATTERVTTTASDDETVTAQPTATPTPTATATPTPEPDDDDDAGVGPLESLVSLVVVGVLAVAGSTVCYAGAVAAGAAVFGAEAVSGLPFSAKLRLVPQMTMSTLIGGSAALASFLGRLSTAADAVGSGLGTATVSLGGVLAAAVRGPALVGRGVAAGFGGAATAFGAALSNLSLGLGTRGSRDSGADVDTDARDADGTDPEAITEAADPGPRSISEAFEALLSELPLRRKASKTPAEVARAAIDRGWPAGPVQRLTETFREVRYGGREETDDRTTRARDALARLREHWGDSK